MEGLKRFVGAREPFVNGSLHGDGAAPHVAAGRGLRGHGGAAFLSPPRDARARSHLPSSQCRAGGARARFEPKGGKRRKFVPHLSFALDGVRICVNASRAVDKARCAGPSQRGQTLHRGFCATQTSGAQPLYIVATNQTAEAAATPASAELSDVGSTCANKSRRPARARAGPGPRKQPRPLHGHARFEMHASGCRARLLSWRA